MQINLTRDERYFELLSTRDGLRIKRDKEGLNAAEASELKQAEQQFKAHTAMALEAQSELVEAVRGVAVRYGDQAS